MELQELTKINVHFRLNSTISWLRHCNYTLLVDIDDKKYALKFLNKHQLESLRENCEKLLMLTENLSHEI